MPEGLKYYECCKHCGDDCGAKDRHRFPRNACQPRVIDPPEGIPNEVPNQTAN